jgi:hypothetical protein
VDKDNRIQTLGFTVHSSNYSLKAGKPESLKSKAHLSLNHGNDKARKISGTVNFMAYWLSSRSFIPYPLTFHL